MPKTKITKERVNITIDKELLETIKKHNLKLSTLINNYLSTLFSSPYSLKPLQGEDRRFNSGQAHSTEIRDLSLEIGEKPKSDVLINSNQNNTSREICLKSVYFKIKSVYFIDCDKRFSHKYSKTIQNRLDKLFNSVSSITKPSEVLNAIEKYNLEPEHTLKGFRNLLNYLDKKEIIPDDTIDLYRRKIKTITSNGVDTFIPTKKQIDNSLSILNEINSNFALYYKLILESGCRFTEFKHFILNFNKEQIEEWDNYLLLYRNFYIRGNKSSYYLFFIKKTFTSLEIDKINEKELNKFVEITIRNKDIISLKYLRKYMFSNCLEKNIPLHIAEYYQGRSSKSIGITHYTNLKLTAIREYKKINLLS